jgi:hypothetical protein
VSVERAELLVHWMNLSNHRASAHAQALLCFELEILFGKLTKFVGNGKGEPCR